LRGEGGRRNKQNEEGKEKRRAGAIGTEKKRER